MTVADWAGLLGGVAAVIAAVVSVTQAISARKARREAQAASADAAARAGEANAALSRMAAAQETLATASRPSAWGVPLHMGGDLWTIRNTSGKSIVLTRVETTPSEAQSLLEVGGSLPRQLPPGDLLEFSAHARLGIGIRIVTLTWHFSDEAESELHDSKRTLR